MRIRIQQLKLMRLRIHNPDAKKSVGLFQYTPFTQMEPQVSCTFCSAVFPERGSLDLHTMTEHGEMMQLLAEEHLGRRALLYSSSFLMLFF
jgi:hypothetical protein